MHRRLNVSPNLFNVMKWCLVGHHEGEPMSFVMLHCASKCKCNKLISLLIRTTGKNMIDHVTISVSDLEQSRKFYEQAFRPLGYKLAFGEQGKFWAFDLGKGFLFEICSSKTKGALTSFHIAFRAPSQQKVHEFYDAALLAGAKDNGAPGPRPQYTENYYACFVHDPDGHNIEAMFDKWGS
jgi:catechol 2,3-dioxygenase-like lactoylglutathione lyase family enzyme